jgi:hypothetical protein
MRIANYGWLMVEKKMTRNGDAGMRFEDGEGTHFYD